MEELDSNQRVSTRHHQSNFCNFNNVDPPHMGHKITGMTSQRVKKSHHKALESKRPCTSSPGPDLPLLSFSSGSSGYKSVSSDSAQAFQEFLPHAGVIPSEQLPLASEWVKV
jgi:hypothetical protein